MFATKRTGLVTSTSSLLFPAVLTPTHPSDNWLSPWNASKNQQWGLCSFLLLSAFYSTTGWIHVYPNRSKKHFFTCFYCRNIFSKNSGFFFSSCPPLQLCLLPPLPYKFQWRHLCPGLSVHTKTKFMNWKCNLPRQKAVQKLTAALFTSPKINQHSQTCIT